MGFSTDHQGEPLPEEIPDCLLNEDKKKYIQKEKEAKQGDKSFEELYGFDFGEAGEITSRTAGKVLDIEYIPHSLVKSVPF